MTITIKGRPYGVEVIPAHDSGSVAVRLTKPDGTAYDVVLDRYGLLHCDCGDYEFRRMNTAEACKHGKALLAEGVIRRPSGVRAAS